jgi:glycosyltransferase involved in cell wall biosynthesis
MKVCFLTGEYPPMQGGVADHTAHLARHLVGLGVDVSVLTSTEAGSDLHVYPIISGWGLGCWRQIGHWLNEHCPDVLHIQYQAAAYDLRGWVNWLPWWLRRRQARPRVVVTFHDLRVPYLFPKAGPLRWRSILALARYSDAVIVTNVEDERSLRKVLRGADSGTQGLRESGNRDSGNQVSGHHFLISRFPDFPIPRFPDSLIPRFPDSLSPDSPTPAILTLIPLGSNVHSQPPLDYDRDGWRAQMGIGERTLLLAYFGFLNESKGGEDLVRALEGLVRQGHDAHLLMIGGHVGDVDPTNRAYAERVRLLVQTCGLVGRVHWTGYTSLEEVSANMLAADMVVMPYRDGVSFRRTTFIAALCHGRPVVTTYPVVPLIELQDGENVLLFPPHDVDSLAGAIARLAGDAELRARLSAGAAALGDRFDWAVIGQQTLDLYRRLDLE